MTGETFVHPALFYRSDREYLDGLAAGEPVWAARSDTEYPASAQHEALINVAFAGRDVTIVCPYDASALSAEAVTARYNLPLAVTGTGEALLRSASPIWS